MNVHTIFCWIIFFLLLSTYICWLRVKVKFDAASQHHQHFVTIIKTNKNSHQTEKEYKKKITHAHTENNESEKKKSETT